MTVASRWSRITVASLAACSLLASALVVPATATEGPPAPSPVSETSDPAATGDVAAESESAASTESWAGVPSAGATSPTGDPVQLAEEELATSAEDAMQDALEFASTPGLGSDESPLLPQEWAESFEPTQAAGAVPTGTASLLVNVVQSGSQQPLAGVDVTLTLYCDTCTDAAVESVTDADGQAIFSDLPAGDVSIRAADHVGGHIVGYADASLDEGGSVGRTLELRRGGSVSGTVTDVAGDPVAGGGVSLYDEWGDWTSAGGCTAADGTYQTTGVSGGAYVAVFRDKQGRYVPQWYEGATSQDDASTLAVQVGKTVANVDATMTAGAIVSGPSPSPIRGSPPPVRGFRCTRMTSTCLVLKSTTRASIGLAR